MTTNAMSARAKSRAPRERSEVAVRPDGSPERSEWGRRRDVLGALVGIWIGVDVGTVRVGVARSDAAGILASPLATLNRDTADNTDVAELAALVRESGAVGRRHRSADDAEGAGGTVRAHGARVRRAAGPASSTSRCDTWTNA